MMAVPGSSHRSDESLGDRQMETCCAETCRKEKVGKGSNFGRKHVGTTSEGGLEILAQMEPAGRLPNQAAMEHQQVSGYALVTLLTM